MRQITGTLRRDRLWQQIVDKISASILVAAICRIVCLGIYGFVVIVSSLSFIFTECNLICTHCLRESD